MFSLYSTNVVRKSVNTSVERHLTSPVHTSELVYRWSRLWRGTVVPAVQLFSTVAEGKGPKACSQHHELPTRIQLRSMEVQINTWNTWKQSTQKTFLSRPAKLKLKHSLPKSAISNIIFLKTSQTPLYFIGFPLLRVYSSTEFLHYQVIQNKARKLIIALIFKIAPV